jgi:NADPH-dependent curcumin reductase CurA
MTESNRKLVLRQRPSGEVGDEHFELVEEPLPDPRDGQVVVRTGWLSFDPAQRGWLNDVRSYTPPVGLGEVMRARGVGTVVASANPDFAVGALVQGDLGWQEFAVLDATEPGVLEGVPDDVDRPEMMLGVLGLTGLTAYFGMLDVARPGDGDVVLVTAAAGATGSIAGQLAKIKGAGTVIGTAGSEEKRSWVCDVAGFDECLDHYDDQIRRNLQGASAPNGFDVVFDNVGGALLDAALFNIAVHGRIALCGSISTGYRPERPEVGLHYYQLLTTRRSRMEGFLVSDYSDRFEKARRDLQRWSNEGSLRQEYDVLRGLEQAPSGLNRLFTGGNLGKQLLALE